jgi:surface polysaccharide O-acyltransferase-like enzyme
LAIDRVKACSILAVVVTHAGPPRWSPQWTAVDEWVRLTWPAFHVPAFLVIAGVLYRSSGPMDWTEVLRRVNRVVLPYVVALTVLYATGLAPWPGWRELPFAVATGSSYGILYFVPVLVACVLFGWILSRCRRRTIWGITFVLLAYSIGTSIFVAPTRWPTFWGIRDPLGRFYFGFFALGWLGVPAQVANRSRRALLGFFALSVLGLWTVYGVPPPWPLRVIPLRLIYTLAVIALLWNASWEFPGMRFLSEASLGLYLFHRPAMDLLPVALDGWPSLCRIAGFTVSGLGAATSLCLSARAVFGRDAARKWLGA